MEWDFDILYFYIANLGLECVERPHSAVFYGRYSKLLWRDMEQHINILYFYPSDMGDRYLE